jgi:hypothetical protein
MSQQTILQRAGLKAVVEPAPGFSEHVAQTRLVGNGEDDMAAGRPARS